MNFYAIIILVALILDYFLHSLAAWLNIRSAQDTVPAEFQDYYDQKEYRRSQEYLRVNTRFGFITSSVMLLLVVIFWFAGGFNALDLSIRQWHIATVWRGLIFIAVLMLLKFVITLPFSCYSTFVIEERFGFNRTTVKTYIGDMLKSVLLTIALGAPLLAGILLFLQFAGSPAWLYCWGVATLFMLIVQFIAPVWIMPLFYKFRPLQNEELKQAVLNYADKVKFPVGGVFEIDGSRRSAHSNAFIAGFGNYRRIALFDTLIEKHTVAELVAVLAHEIGHWKRKHIQQGLLLGIIHTGFLFLLLQVFIGHEGLYEAFGMQHTPIYAGLVFFGLLYAPVEMLLGIILQKLSRRNEYQADRYAAETAAQPDALITALQKLSVHNLANLTPHPLHVILNYSHPPILQRIQALQKMIMVDDD